MTMQTRTHAPMLGSLVTDPGYRLQDKRGNALARPMATIERRIARRYEAAMLAADLADETASLLAEVTITVLIIDWSDAYVDDLLDTDRYADLLDVVNDPEVTADLTDPDLPGWGDVFDPDDIQWGFRVTAMDKAPGVVSGRPRPAQFT